MANIIVGIVTILVMGFMGGYLYATKEDIY